MTAKDIQKHLHRELKEVLKPHGFIYDKKAFQYIKTTQGGHWSVGPSFVNLSPLFKIGYAFSIRIHEVEEIYKNYSRILPDYQKYSSTIIVKYDYFKEKRYFQYNLYNSEELSMSIRDFRHLFESQVLPFLDKYSRLKSLFDLVDKGEIKNLDSSASPDCYLHWLIIAKQCGKVELKSLANDYFEDFWKNNEVEPDRKRVQMFLQDFITG